jgi:hypothetical protein
MTTKNNIIAIILLAIPTLVLCGLIIYFERSLNTCQGLAHTMRDIFLFALLIGASLLFLVIQLYKIITQPIQRLTRMIVSLFLITFVIFSIRFDWKNSQFDDVLLSAISVTASSDYGELKLLNKTDFYVVYGHMDWSCSTTGFYEISFDTLKLEGNPAEKSDGILANIYLMSSSQIVPIQTDTNLITTPVVLEIERPK